MLRLARFGKRRRRHIARQQRDPAGGRLETDPSERTAAVILQQRVRRLFDIDVTALQAETAACGDGLDHADAIASRRQRAVACRQQCRIALQQYFGEEGRNLFFDDFGSGNFL